MNSWLKILDDFLLQSFQGTLETWRYPEQWNDFKMEVSFGQGLQAKIPWIAFLAPQMKVSKGIYPVYLFYKDLSILILAYGVSEENKPDKNWPPKVTNSVPTVKDYFKARSIPLPRRYGDSFVFKAYKIRIDDGKVSYEYLDENKTATEKDIETDLSNILDEYKKYMDEITSQINHLFYEIAWRPNDYKGGFCGKTDHDACKAFHNVKENRERKECNNENFHCIDEHEAFKDEKWKVNLHIPMNPEKLDLKEGESLIFLVAPTDKYKNKSRLVGFYTLKEIEKNEEGKAKGLVADEKLSSKFDFQNNELELGDEELKELFGIQEWTRRTSHEVISSETALKVLEDVYKKHEGKAINDPDVKLEAMGNAIERLRLRVSTPQSPMEAKSILGRYFSSKGFYFEESLIAAFYVALKTKGFVILAGLTGTGKTKLPLLFLDLISKNDQKLFLPVRPDWRDSKPLVGYFNPIQGVYESTELLELIRTASENCQNTGKATGKAPFFVLLDEMNLARVEYYFADFLSVLESGREENYFTKESILLAESECETRNHYLIKPKIKLPPNLYFVGTVNLDETTYSFSPKVLDRAFVVEFWKVDFESYSSNLEKMSNLKIEDEVGKKILDDLSRGNKFLFYTKEDIAKAIESLKNNHLFEDLKRLHEKLQNFNLHFGYRVIEDIALFYQNALESREKEIICFCPDEKDEKIKIIDYAVLMKVLPKLHGNRAKLGEPLREVMGWALNPEKDEKIDEKDLEKELREKGPRKYYEELRKNKNPKYENTLEKIVRMLHQLYTAGFTSYL